MTQDLYTPQIGMSSYIQASPGYGHSLYPAETFFPAIYDDLRRLAEIRMMREPSGQTLQPTALVHEAWLKLTEAGPQEWDNRAHFVCAAVETMRRIMIDRARRKSRVKHGGDLHRIEWDEIHSADTLPDGKIVLLNEALARLKSVDEEAARIVTLKFFGGFTNEEIGGLMGLSDSSIRRQWQYAKLLLFHDIQRHS